MKIIIKNIVRITFQVVFLAVLVASCKDEEEDALALSRMFTPAACEFTNGETEATVAWSPALFTISGEAEYKVEISKNPQFTNVEFSETTSSVAVTFLDTDIDIRVDYFVRVK